MNFCKLKICILCVKIQIGILHILFSQRFIFSVKIQINYLASFHQKSNLCTKIELLPQCVQCVVPIDIKA